MKLLVELYDFLSLATPIWTLYGMWRREGSPTWSSSHARTHHKARDLASVQAHAGPWAATMSREYNHVCTFTCNRVVTLTDDRYAGSQTISHLLTHSTPDSLNVGLQSRICPHAFGVGFLRTNFWDLHWYDQRRWRQRWYTFFRRKLWLLPASHLGIRVPPVSCFRFRKISSRGNRPNLTSDLFSHF